MIVVFMGIQGCGKGTQSNLLTSEYKFKHINMGDLFRQEVKNHTAIGEHVQEIMTRGELIPDEVVFQVLEKALQNEDCRYVFDGFPRTTVQAEYLQKHHPIQMVIHMKLDDETARQRMLSRRICTGCKKDYNLIHTPPKSEGICDHCGAELVSRPDDTEESINKRIQIFHSETKPLLDMFREIGILREINADQSINTIFDYIKKEIELIIK